MNREEDLLSDLMNQYGQSVWSFIYSITKDATITDDLSQEVFIQAYRHLHDFRGDASYKTWLFSIAKNKCRDHFRSAFVRRVTFSGNVPEDHGDSVEEQVMRTMQQNAVWDSLLQLKPAYREVVFLHVREEMTFGEVGKVMGIPETTARAKYHRAVRQLREILGKEMETNGIWGNA